MTHQRLAAQHRRSYEDGKPETVRIWLLGGFRVSVGSRIVEGSRWRLKKAVSLVKLLALTRGHALHREQIMDVFWPDLDKKSAANNLRRVLHFARRALEPDAVNTAPRYLLLQGDMLALCPDGQLWVDVEAFESAAVNARRSREPAAYRAAVELYAGELLPGDRYEEWTEERRWDLRARYVALLVELAGLHEEREDYGPAIETLRRVVSEEPAREEAHLGLMRLYAMNGQRQQALLQYQRLKEALATELEKEPDVGNQRLYEEILTGRFPQARSNLDRRAAKTLRGAAGKHNLPNSPSSFVGREQEMVEIKCSLAMTQLLTLTGAGGSGKTRLALEVARDFVGAYPDGVWLVELAPLSDGELVPQVAAEVLGVRERPDLSLSETLSNHLRSRRTLLILDNCEHLIGACARLTHMLLGACPKLKVLATSREALGVPGEAVWPVLPLTVPEDSSSTPERLAGYEAVRLFLERARSKLPAFELTSANSRAIVEVCRKLDGIPLAIELAAARVTALAVGQVAARLADSLRLLTGGERTAEPRHRTMRATLEWSYDLLGGPERKLFGRLSVFAGGWTLEAVEAIGEGGEIAHGEVLDLLSKLIDKSLVVAEGGPEDTLRYRMLEPVRQYGRLRLKNNGEAERVRQRHAEYYLAFVERAEPELSRSRQRLWLERLEEEHDNLRAALSWFLERTPEPNGPALGLRMAAALWRFWSLRGHKTEGRGWLEKGLSGSDASPAVRAKALSGLGWITLFQGDYDIAITSLEESLALFEELNDKSGAAVSFTHLGYAALHRGDIGKVGSLRQKAEKLRQELEDPEATAYLLLFLGSATMEEDLGRAAALLEEGLALYQGLGDTRCISVCTFTLGMIASERGDFERAAALLREGLPVAQGHGDNLGIAYYLWGLGGVAAGEEQLVRAARLWGAAEALRETLGLRLSYLDLAHSSYEERLAAARSQVDEAAFEAAFSEGRAMSPEQALEYALGEEEPPPPATPGPQRDPDRATDSLTRREREVALLAARGLTNRRIASELSISEHTVANHLRNILKKLGLRSRAQIPFHP